MNDKLVWRAAAKYREWIKKVTARPPELTTIETYLASMQNKSTELGAWVRRFIAGNTQRSQVSSNKIEHFGICNPQVYDSIATCMIPDISVDLISSIQVLTESMRRMVDRKPTAIPTQKEAMEEIRAIMHAWPQVEYNRGKLSVVIENVVLEDDNEGVYLGSFMVYLDLSNPLNKGFTVESLDMIESPNGYYHPHVSGNGLCTGDGALPMKEALIQGRLEDYFRIVEAILRTYNQDSPYESLQEWYDPDHEGQFYCEHCYEWRDDECSVWCSGCETQYCDNCDPGGGCCEDCGEWYCSNCCTSCNSCSETICNGCKVECQKCGEDYCDECMKSCAYCGDKMCEDCSVTCECCGDESCTSCVDKECSQCHESICKGCQQTCDHCGTHMCPSCKKEHNCLLEGV